MNELTVFQNEQFGEIRTVLKEGDPWFVAADVCAVLRHSNVSVALQMLDDDERAKQSLGQVSENGVRQEREMNIVSEAGLYQLIIRSNLPTAKQFKRWITHEVIPSIRRHGFYGTDQAIDSFLSDPDRMIQVLTAYKQERTRRLSLEREAGINAPKVFFAESVAASKHSILVGELAKLLKQNGIEVGQNRLFKWLRRDGYLIKRGDSYNMPTQYSMENEWMEIKERVLHNPDGSIRVWRTPKVTGKGQVYFISRYLAEPI